VASAWFPGLALFGEPLRSAGDVLADTMVLYDPDGILALRGGR
jgi:hypothetical protein